MKTIINISLVWIQILLIISCKNSIDKDQPSIKTNAIDTTSIINKTYGTIIKSKPFKINGIECYWEQTDTLTEEGTMDLIKLKAYKTNRILVNHIDCCLKYGFDMNTTDHFIDVNFDGFKDFLIRSYGSTAMFEETHIYLFDNKAKQFTPSDLSDNIIEPDSIHRKLITSSFDRNFEKTKTHYFDNIGKLKHTEIVTIEHWDTTPYEYKTYEKIVNGKVVETKKDSIMYSEK